MKIRLPYHYTPRSYQRCPFVDYEHGIKRFMNVWHRRSGKDKTWLNFTIMRAMERKGMYAHILPTYKQAKGIIWDGIGADGFRFMDHFPEELVVGKNETELKVELANGSIYRLLGSDNTDQLVGMNPVGLVFSEYAIQDPQAWALLSPILVENQGWASFIFTPRGKNHAFDLWEANKQNPEWSCSLLTIAQTRRDAEGESGAPVITDADVENEINSGNIDQDTAKQEYYCDFAGVFAGSYYGTLISELYQRDQIKRIPYDPSLPVFTVWDLGRHDATAIWFVQSLRGFEYRVIDYYEEEGYPLDYHIRQVRLKPYVYADHFAPHDINVTEYTTGVSRYEAARRLGITFRVIPKLPIYDGIAAARAVLPKCWFDAQRCAKGLKALQNYHREYDDKHRVYRDIPVHDWASHGADAWRYFASSVQPINDYTNTAVTVEKDFDVLGREASIQMDFDPYNS
jgi:hypothetical protein